MDRYITIGLQAPVGVMTVFIRGKVKLRMPAKGDSVSEMSMVVNEMPTKSVVDANCPSHSLLTLNCREHLSRILESDWSFSQGVGDGEEVDKSS